tara:strand:- start:13663 stop:13893 length:231 start_codon:yes stop_codon:yes gene_type:complete
MENLNTNAEAIMLIFGLLFFFGMLFLAGCDVMHRIYVDGKKVKSIFNDGDRAEWEKEHYENLHPNAKVELKSQIIF